MFIQLDDKYAIKADKYQYILCEAVKKTDKQRDGWKGFRYYKSLDNCVADAAEIMLRTSDAVGVAKVLEENKRILRTLAGALSFHFDVEIKEKHDG